MSMPPFASSDPGRSDSDSEGSRRPGLPKTDANGEPDSPPHPAVSRLLSSRMASASVLANQDFAASQMAAAVSRKRLPERSEESLDSQSPKRARLHEARNPLPSNLAGPRFGNEPDSNSNMNFANLLHNLAAGREANTIATNASLLDNESLRAQLSAKLMQEQASRNAAILASISQPNLNRYVGSQAFGSTHLAAAPGPGFLSLYGAHHQQSQQIRQLAALRNLADLQALQRSTSLGLSLPPAPSPFPLGQGIGEQPGLTGLIRHTSAPAPTVRPDIVQQRTVVAAASMPAPVAASLGSRGPKHVTDLPMCEEGRILPYDKRTTFPLGVDEDSNWLSEFHCFVRSELVEVFRASHGDVKSRNNSIVYKQVGLRCRFCAHMVSSARCGRSSAFPSSLRQIYQSFTMMLRDHFGNCEAIPARTQETFLTLKDRPAQGATDSKRFWMYSAMKLGLADSPDGIIINESTRATGANAAPFGSPPSGNWSDDAFRTIPLILSTDRGLVSEFLCILMSQVQVVRLTEAERIGNRRSLRVGLPGFGCRFCCDHRRMGLCRMFPARRRTLPSKVCDLYDHMRRCSVCPPSIKEQLKGKEHQLKTGYQVDQGSDREFFDRVWNRLGHGNGVA